MLGAHGGVLLEGVQRVPAQDKLHRLMGPPRHAQSGTASNIKATVELF